MSELSSDAKSLIEAARPGDGATSRDKARIKARLTAELGAGAFAASAVGATRLGPDDAPAQAASTSGAPGAPLTGSSGLWLKVAKLATVAGAAGALYGGVVLLRGPEVAPRSASERPASPASETPAIPPPEPEHVPSQEQAEVDVPAPTQEPLARTGKRSRGTRRAATPEMASDAAAGSLEAELALLALGQRALRERKADEALAIAQRHAATFPDGALREERAGIEALARCMQGDTRAGRAFLARSPSSPLAARIRKECETP